MKANSRTVDDVEIISLQGKITIGSGDTQLREVITNAVNSGKNKILLDLSGVTTIDSSGIGDFKDGYTSGTFRKEVDKGAVDPNKLVEVWRSPLIPNGPLVVRNALGTEWQAKLTDFFMKLPTADAKCFNAVEGGDFKGYVKVTPDFYNAVIDVRKAAIGG